MKRIVNLVNKVSLKFIKNPVVQRHGGILEHWRLKRVFKRIGNDPYVKSTRERLENAPHNRR